MTSTPQQLSPSDLERHAPEAHYEDLLVLAGYIDPALPSWIAATSKVPHTLGAKP